MSWTVACFCGNTFTTPPNRCEVCGASVKEFVAPSPVLESRMNETPMVHPTPDEAAWHQMHRRPTFYS